MIPTGGTLANGVVYSDQWMSGGGLSTIAEREPRAPAAPTSRRRLSNRWVAAGVGSFLLGIEVDSAVRVLRSGGLLTAHPARYEVLAFAVAAAAIVALALVPHRHLRPLAALGPLLFLAGVLVATATLGGHALDMVAAVLCLGSSWWVGGRLLGALGARRLADHAAVAWLAGLGPLCLLSLLVGRVSLFRWWTLGIIVVVTGTIGCTHAAQAMWQRRSAITTEAWGTSIGAAATGLIALTLAAAAIYTAAPEIQYDPLYGKAYLPLLWARTGSIGPLNQHIQLNITGWLQLGASWGNLLGAPATGRYLQLFGLAAVAVAVWTWGRRFGSFGPLAAVAVVITPTLFWQATTADDDLLLALAVFALGVAVLESLSIGSGTDDRAAGLAIGLLAGTGISLKSHLIPISIVLLLGWMLAGGRERLGRRAVHGVLGAFITGAPPLILRWIDTGNPVFPAYNNIFKSPYWLPVNEKLNFPFFPHPGTLGPFKAIWDAMVSPGVMQEAAPPGALGALIGIVLVAALVGWRHRRRTGGVFVLWIAIVIAVLAWWIEFRYLRYLLPAAFASVVLLLAISGSPARMSSRARTGTAVMLGVATAAAFAVSVAQFWNVPNKRVPISASIGRWDAGIYLDTALPERSAVLAFNALAPPGSAMVTDAFERDWLTQGRDLYAPWEVTDLLQLRGQNAPASGAQAFARLKAMGVGWALVTGANRMLSGSAWLPEVLRTHGQPRFSAVGWDLYQLVAHPTAPSPAAACDSAATGLPTCWAGPRTGIGAAGGPLTRTIGVCPGQVLSVSVAESSGGPPSPVVIQFPTGSPLTTGTTGLTAPGATQPTAATVPLASHQAMVTIATPPGATITHAVASHFGPSCAG